ncbi:hypothetical protein AN936_22255 [Sphingopyxis macrogoltabida]|uniref:Uncharacterized protein n=1 Tax=Sphingopyxis macrogoltabida TaxID=33050 RepID=A0A0N9UC10_SPHMC|nr:hypothetical protein AN936_22255 [Sphingopyxis macrogoltabida]
MFPDGTPPFRITLAAKSVPDPFVEKRPGRDSVAQPVEQMLGNVEIEIGAVVPKTDAQNRSISIERRALDHR